MDAAVRVWVQQKVVAWGWWLQARGCGEVGAALRTVAHSATLTLSYSRRHIRSVSPNLIELHNSPTNIAHARSGCFRLMLMQLRLQLTANAPRSLARLPAAAAETGCPAAEAAEAEAGMATQCRRRQPTRRRS